VDRDRELKATHYEVDERVATLTLARPHRLNAWTGRMHEEYRWCLQQAEDDPEVRVVVITGEGRGFCAGADAAALDKHREAGEYDDGVRAPLATPGYGVRPEFDHPFAFQMGMRTPIIAAVNGPAAGIGLVVACFADLRFAAAGAKLTTAHGKLNLPAEYGLSWLLPRIVGVGRALDLLLSSRVVLAEEAERMGLVNGVLPADELLPHTYEYARMLATTVSPRSLAESKRQVWVDQHRDVGSSVAEAEALLEEMVREPDFAEGSRALSEKRPPEFS
jgi:enoyl-CoA hydratase/carnithine racemase